MGKARRGGVVLAELREASTKLQIWGLSTVSGACLMLGELGVHLKAEV